MTNNDTMNTQSPHYKLFRRADGSTGLIQDPLGNCIIIPDAVEVEELDLTPIQAAELRTMHREAKLDFTRIKREAGLSEKRVEPDNRPNHSA